MESGPPDKQVGAYWTDCDVPWVSLNDTGYLRTHDYVTKTAFNVNSLGIANSSARLLPPRAVVFSRDATVGLFAITTVSMAVSQHFIAWLCGEEIVPEYLLQVFRAMTEELERLTMGATVKTIGMPLVRTLVVPVPPLDEQAAIVTFLNRKRSQIDILIAKKQRLIELLQEKRQALISHVVTKGLDPNVPRKDSGVEWIGTMPRHWESPRTRFVAKLESGHTPSRNHP